ncbi:MAG TPA: hypothetical protein VN808_21625 [Stellaceae bacterium]|nr:hypothetical protein [Stellaceae bacterium]
MRVIAENAADIPHTLGDAAVTDKDVRPDRVHDLVAVDKAPRVFDKMTQECERFGPKGALHTVRQQRAALKVQNKAVELVSRRCFGSHPSSLRQISEKFQPDFSRVSRQGAQDAVYLPTPIRQLSRIVKRENGDDGMPSSGSESPPHDFRPAEA